MSSISHKTARQLTSWLKQQRVADLRPLSQLLTDPSLSVTDLLELAAFDLFECWRNGSPRSVETYLVDFPELSERAEHVLDLIDAEVCAHREKNESVSLEELKSRFPNLSEPLARMLEIESVEQNLMQLVNRPPEIASFAESLDMSLDVSLTHKTGSQQILLDGQSIEPPEGIRLVGLTASRLGVQLYRAMAKVDRRPLAVKVIRQSLADRRTAEEWLNHLELATKLKNPRFVPAELAIANFHHFVLVRNWVEGLTWSEWASRNAPAEVVLRPLVAIADALQTAHTAGLPHGHIHPGNLLIDHNGLPHVTDLGCSAISSQAHDWRSIADDPRSCEAGQLKCRDRYAVAALTLAVLDRQEASAMPRWRGLHSVMQQARATPNSVTAELLAEAIRRSLDGREPTVGGNSSWIRRWWNTNIRTGELK